MDDFKLDARLEKDCFEILDTKNRKILLMDNSDYLWFILVPKTNCTEFYELNMEAQSATLVEMNKLSKVIKEDYKYNKVNIGIIGNVVSQLHVHIIGRNHNDLSWPNVVWGCSTNRRYSQKDISIIENNMLKKL